MSTTELQAIEALDLTFVTAWTTTGFTYQLENETFKKPDAAPWARFSYLEADAPQDSLGGVGNRKFLRQGIATAQVFVLAQQAANSPGVAQAWTLARVVRAAFEGVSGLQGTNLRVSRVVVRPVGLDGKWYQINVEISTEYDETK